MWVLRFSIIRVSYIQSPTAQLDWTAIPIEKSKSRLFRMRQVVTCEESIVFR